MKILWWRIRLFALMNWFGYTPTHRFNVIATWKWTGEECWIDFYDEEYDPLEALKEDWSYA